jgi:hypothetical protein
VQEQPLLKPADRFIEPGQKRKSRLRYGNEDDPTVFMTSLTEDHTCLLKTIDQTRDPRYDGDRSTGDLQDGQWLSFAAEYAQHVVL